MLQRRRSFPCILSFHRKVHNNEGNGLMTQGLRWLVGLHDNGCNGILADEVLHACNLKAHVYGIERVQHECASMCADGPGEDSAGNVILMSQAWPEAKTVQHAGPYAVITQVIALLACLKEVRSEQAPAMVVTPASLTANWSAFQLCKRSITALRCMFRHVLQSCSSSSDQPPTCRQAEFERWAPSLRVAVYKGTAAARANVWEAQVRMYCRTGRQAWMRRGKLVQ